MFNTRTARLLWQGLNWLTRLTIVTSSIIAALLAICIITLRYWLLPEIEQFHDKITASLSTAMGNPVTIGKINGDWNGLHPHLNLNNLRILDQQGKAALILPNVDASVSWLSILAAELRLSSLEIDRPKLIIRRNQQGLIYIGNMPINTTGNNNDFSNWLLQQSRMVIRNANIVWLDEQHDAPPLILNAVNLRIESLFSHHRFAIRATPPDTVSTPLDLRGDFYGKRFDQLEKWHGKLFTQIDYTDLLAWRPWLKLPSQLSSGRGALRGWLSIEKGKLGQLTLDMALHDIATRLAENTPEMDVHTLNGRIAWTRVNEGWELATHHLTLRLHNGLALQPTDFYYRSVLANGKNPGEGELRANTLQLETLVSLANFLPLDPALHQQLNSYGPRGQVFDLNMRWQGAATSPLTYQIKGKFNKLALQSVDNLPGFSGLTATVDGNQKSGSITLSSQNLTVDAPNAMRDTLFFHTLTGQVGWQNNQNELAIQADNISLANDDLAGNLFGSFHTQKNTLGILDLTVNLTRANIRQAARYTPFIALAKKENDWLNNAMRAGHTEDFHLRLKGNLSDFPLDGTKNAIFEIGAHAQDVSVKFDPDWPSIDNLSGEFVMHGNRLEVKSPSSTLLGAHIHNLIVTHPDMSKPATPLEIKGVAEGTNNGFLQFIQQSPVRGYINGFTDGMTASGNGHLDLSLKIPLLLDRPVTVKGLMRVQSSDIDLGPTIPMLHNTRGELAFTESSMQANNVAADILGGPAHLNLQTQTGGSVNATLQGRANLDQWRTPTAELSFLHGSTIWDATINIVKKVPQITINSNLLGISSSLPAPLTKSANEVWPLHIEKKAITEKQGVINAQLGKLLRARLYLSEENGESVIKRGMVNFGTQEIGTDAKSRPGIELQSGVWFSGTLPTLSIQGWDTLMGKSGSTAFPISGGKLHIDKLTGYGMSLHDLSISATKRNEGLAAQLKSNAINGEIDWRPASPGDNGKLTAHLRNFYWSNESTTPAEKLGATTRPVTAGQRPLPEMEIAIEDFLFKGKQIGRIEVIGLPEGHDWRLKHLHITNPDGSVTGNGLWRSNQTHMQTQLNILLEISNAGKILARSGYPNTVKNGSGKLTANLSWDGQPDEFNYATLDGTIKLDTGQGQFLKMEPGFGKLLGIMSLQALPKRITLDFTDVFSSGFEFDNINGNATIKRGVMDTQDLHIDGSSAKVTMKGQVNLNDETQKLHVVILPTLGSSVSMLSAFAAGPVVGLGTLIVSKVLGNPLDKLMSFEYNINGTWGDPNVIKVGEIPVKLKDLPKPPTYK